MRNHALNHLNHLTAQRADGVWSLEELSRTGKEKEFLSLALVRLEIVIPPNLGETKTTKHLYSDSSVLRRTHNMNHFAL